METLKRVKQELKNLEYECSLSPNNEKNRQLKMRIKIKKKQLQQLINEQEELDRELSKEEEEKQRLTMKF
jgi:hypothetical protein